MSNLFKKIKYWLHQVRMREYSYERGGLNPAKDWTVSLIFSITTIIVFVAFSFYLYMQIDAGKIFTISGVGNSNETKINMVMLDKIVSDINQREQITSDVRQNKDIPVDPSI